MTDILLIVSIAISIVSVAILFVVLKNTKNTNSNIALEQKIDYINKNMGDEFHRIRVENHN